MTDETGGDQPQKTVAELLAQHGQQVDGGRRRRRRAAEDDEAPETETETAPRRSRMSDTAPQAIIDRVTADGGNPPASRGGTRRRPDTPPPAPRPAPPDPGAQQRPVNGQQDSGGYPRPTPPGPPEPGPRARPAGPAQPEPGRARQAMESGQYPRPVNGQQEPGGYPRPAPPQESGGYPRPAAGPQESGAYPRPAAPQDSGAYPRPGPGPQESGAYPRPANGQQDSAYVRPPEPGQFARPPQESAQMPLPPRQPRPQAAPGEETRGQVPPVRRRPPPPAAPPAASPNGALSARLDGAPDADAAEQPPMAGGAFPAAAPQRPRRAPARRPAPKVEPHTEQFDAVAGAPEAEAPAEEAPAPGLAGWRKRREQEQLEDTEIGVMPVVPPGAPEVEDDYADEDYADEEYVDEDGYPVDEDGYEQAGNGYPAAVDEYEGGPPTAGYPAPMPFAPGGKDDQFDDLSEYEREFAEPGYPHGEPDFDGDDYDEHGDYDDYPDEELAHESVEDEAPAEEPAASPGKQWLILAGQLALGVVGGAAVWLGFNWLWVNLAPAALVGALLVIVALVWIVRKIRRAEDLQTTLLAILVGLVVTVSPAALLLVAK
ncbi:hypothetical protein GCM10022222_41210 [Amycolatopsis ultiminotia]|uniref:Uncharacterized protein n=1 Tax=Amycolatopsis ultiminotia TaxID=543629 RepID=A0ABP6WP01_9PSEU